MFHPASQPAYLQVTLKSGSHVSWSNLSGIKACKNKQLNGVVQQQGQFELGAFTELLSPASKSLGNYTLTVYIIIPAPMWWSHPILIFEPGVFLILIASLHCLQSDLYLLLLQMSLIVHSNFVPALNILLASGRSCFALQRAKQPYHAGGVDGL